MILDSIKIHTENFENLCLAKYRRSQLLQEDFSIISNNCWGGHVYRRYGLPYLSPTIGLYFFSEEYINLLLDLKTNFNSSLRFINWQESKYRDVISEKNQKSVPIGLLNEKIEIMFLHYSNKKEAYEKWMRRCERVNYDNLIVKISQMNLCSFEHLKSFEKLDYEKKVAFVTPQCKNLISCAVPIRKYSNSECVVDDTTYYDKHIQLSDFINKGYVE